MEIKWFKSVVRLAVEFRGQFPVLEASCVGADGSRSQYAGFAESRITLSLWFAGSGIGCCDATSTDPVRPSSHLPKFVPGGVSSKGTGVSGIVAH